jgi:hypothetical protein
MSSVNATIKPVLLNYLIYGQLARALQGLAAAPVVSNEWSDGNI